MSALIEKLAMVTVDDHLALWLPKPGPCGGCRTCSTQFICRAGRTLCIHCDAREQAAQAETARLIVAEMFAPIELPCRCKPSRDPDALFKCTCEAAS